VPSVSSIIDPAAIGGWLTSGTQGDVVPATLNGFWPEGFGGVLGSLRGGAPLPVTENAALKFVAVSAAEAAPAELSSARHAMQAPSAELAPTRQRITLMKHRPFPIIGLKLNAN
jgi:hypothetical protein